MDADAKNVVQCFIIAVIAVISVGALFATGNAMTRVGKLEERIGKLEIQIELLRESGRHQIVIIKDGKEAEKHGQDDR